MEFDLYEIKEKLQSDARPFKIEALKQLSRYGKEESNDNLQKIFDECYLYILKCYADRYENVREMAVQIISLYMKRLPPNDFHLLNVLSTLHERIGKVEIIEQSEEIRYNLVVQLYELIDRNIELGNHIAVTENYNNIVPLIVQSLKDNYPVVTRKACCIIKRLSRQAQTADFQRFTEKLAIPLYDLLHHRHSVTRIVALEALGRIALHMDANGEGLTRLFNEISPLLMDCMPLVRRECGLIGALMMLQLRDRYSYFERTLPLVLCCLKDDSQEVVNSVLPLWIDCGKQYYNENESELSKQDLVDVIPKNYPHGVCRPTIGCRGIVQRSLRLLKLIFNEVCNWKEEVRLHSLKLLYQFVLHAEATMTAKFFEIYGDLAKVCGDTEMCVADEACKVADLMGRVLKYEDWRVHAFNGLEKNPKLGHLKCFYFMFTAALNVELNDIVKVSEIIVKEFSNQFQLQFQFYLIKLLLTLLEKANTIRKSDHVIDSNENILVLENAQHNLINKNVYIAAVKIFALSYDTEPCEVQMLHKKIQDCLDLISERQLTDVKGLHELFQLDALDHVENLDAQLDETSQPIVLLCGLIRIASFGPSYVKKMQSHICAVFENCLDSAKLKVFSAVSIAMLKWGEHFGDFASEENIDNIENFLGTVVEEQLKWRPGLSAEGMRSLAVATLCSLGQSAPTIAGQVLSKYLVNHKDLIDDHNVSTRRYFLKCLGHLGEIKLAELKPIAYAVLQRIDDPSSTVREFAVATLTKFNPIFGEAEQYDVDKESWNCFIKAAIDKLMLHYDGPENTLKEQIVKTLVFFRDKYPDICSECFYGTRVLLSNSPAIQKLQAILNINNS